MMSFAKHLQMMGFAKFSQMMGAAAATATPVSTHNIRTRARFFKQQLLKIQMIKKDTHGNLFERKQTETNEKQPHSVPLHRHHTASTIQHPITPPILAPFLLFLFHSLLLYLHIQQQSRD